MTLRNTSNSAKFQKSHHNEWGRPLVQLRAARLSKDVHTWPHGMADAVQGHCGETVPGIWRRAPHGHTVGRGQAPAYSRATGSQACCSNPCPSTWACARASVFVKGLCLGLVSQEWISRRRGQRPPPAPRRGCILLPIVLPWKLRHWTRAYRISLRLPAQGHQKPSYTKEVLAQGEVMSSFLESNSFPSPSRKVLPCFTWIANANRPSESQLLSE